MKVVSAMIEGSSEIVTETVQNKEDNVEKTSEIQDLLRTHDGADKGER